MKNGGSVCVLTIGGVQGETEAGGGHLSRVALLGKGA